MIRAVRVVAGHTVLRYRGVLPQEGATKFCMAVITGVIDRLAGQQQFGGFTVRVVAATAIHLALPHWVGIRLHGLRPLLLVAIETDFRLGGGCQHRVAFGVARVAIGTGDRIVIVRAAVPGKAGIVLVTIRTVRVLLGDRSGRVGAKHYDGRPFLTTPDTTCMIAAGSVTGLALQLTVSKR